MTSPVDKVREQLILVRLRISSWSGKATSEMAARSAEEVNSAQVGEVEAKIHQVSKKYTGPIESLTRALYRWWIAGTLPWGNGGWRIIPVERFADLVQHISSVDAEINAAARDIFTDAKTYREIKRDSKKRLAKLFDERPFPAPDELVDKYGIGFSRETLTDTSDIRLAGMTEVDLDAFRKSIESEYAEHLNAALSDLIDRLRQIALDYVDRVEQANKSNKPARFGGLFRAIREQCETIRGLNLMHDKDINAAIDAVVYLTEVDLQGMNEGDKSTRHMAKGLGKSVIDDLDAIMAERK